MYNQLFKLGYETKAFSTKRYIKNNDILPIDFGLKKWCKNCFKKGNCIIFIGSAGIAVRTIAEFIDTKDKDPSVIVIDENGKYIIPILSGHIGGGNKTAYLIADILGGTPVITTATDINNIFSVDSWAVKNNIAIYNIENIKYISSSLLDKTDIGLISDFNICSKLPENIKLGNNFSTGICISLDKNKLPFKTTLNLIPKCIVIGLGCKKNIDFETVEMLFLNSLKENNLPIEAVKRISSIDLKKEEEAILKLSRKYKIDFVTYSSKQLENLKGNFISSEFVKSVTGVDNVCERAACINIQGRFIQRKTCFKGVTIAIFLESRDIVFNE